MIEGLIFAGAALSIVMALHGFVNAHFLRPLRADAPTVTERVSILIPARNEEMHIWITTQTLLAQIGLDDFEVIVLNDGSTDDTAQILDEITDPRLVVMHEPDEHPPAGWLGKPWACQRLAERATGSVLVFADADVAFAPEAVKAAVHELRSGGYGMVAPEPAEIARTWLERLVQPLLAWAIVTSMPAWWASRSLRPSLSAANGQFLVFDADAYRRFGGHSAVRTEVVEDIAIMRACKRSGAHAATLNGAPLVACRMYTTSSALVDGYAKSAWAAFNGILGSMAVVCSLLLAALAPPLAALFGSTPQLRWWGIAGYLAAVASRLFAGRRFGDRLLPDALLHPVSILVFAWLNLESWRRHFRDANTWKGRPVRV